ncbi:MAG: hypothetical protein NXY57DRAFT_959467 [Lentinula lateritia]|nr:MAG: hypothetical protein NXY57DRAFT_959467 [Lentinula lateritia]
MDAKPRFTHFRARAALPGEDDPAPRQSLSLCQSILGPPPGEVADTPVTPPPTFVQPAWIVPHPNGEDALHACEAIRASRTCTQASNPAESPSFMPPPRNDPVAQFSRASSTARGSLSCPVPKAPLVYPPRHPRTTSWVHQFFRTS